MPRQLIWDLPTRAFHGLFAASFAAAWLTSESEALFAVHMFSGCLMLGLLAFRLVWGLIGGRYARFSSFAYGPRAGLAYLKAARAGQAPRHIGHNPAGSQAIWLLLGLGLGVALIGLATWGLADGRLPAPAAFSGEDGAEALGELHEWLANFMLVVVLAHVAGVIVESRRHGENLAAAMLHGHKDADDATPASRPHTLTGALLIGAALGLGVWWAGNAEFARLPPELTHHHAQHEDGEAEDDEDEDDDEEDEGEEEDDDDEGHGKAHETALPVALRIVDLKQPPLESGMGGTGNTREG